MAITRCPYCHAIIDEADKYCNNCGTQLLFAEDDEIEEEIPGEKIVEADVEEKDYTVDEPEEEKRRKPAKDLESQINEELGDDEEPAEPALEDLVDEDGEDEDEDDVTEEVILVDEIAAAEKRAAAPDTGEPEEDEEEDEEDEDVEVVEDEDLEDEEEETPKKEETREYATGQPKKPAPVPEPAPPAPAEGEPEVEYVVEPPPPDEASTAGEAAFRPATFDTAELENLGRTVELSKAKVDQFLEVMRGQRTPETLPPAPVPPPPPAAAPAEAQAPTPPTQAVAPAEPVPDETPAPSTGSLPPWASSLKGAPVFSEDSGPVETRKLRGGEPAPQTDEEVEIFPKRRSADSTIGLPERISQSPLPFEEAEPKAEDYEELAEEAEEAEAGETEGTEAASYRDLTPEQAVLPAGEVRRARGSVLPGRDAAGGPDTEAGAPEEEEEAGPRPPFSLSVFFKSKAFDVLFVGLFWLVALWLAAASLGVTLFSILASMSGPMLILYVVFLGIYIFLFKFFLGETLGDRLFRPRG